MRADCRVALALVLALPVAATASSLSADTVAPSATHGLASAPMVLYLEVTLNGMARGLHPFTARSGTLWADTAVLLELGFASLPQGHRAQRLDALPGVAVAYDASNQRLALTAPLEQLQLATTAVGPPGITAQRTSSGRGLVFNYDVHGTLGRHRQASLGAFTELRVFHGASLLSSTALQQRARSEGGAWHGRSVRLDTTWSHAFAERMLSLRVGDALTGSLPWTRATRIGGIQLARNFGLQPYRQSAPLPGFIGAATLPSDVELYINGVRAYAEQLPAGPFRLDAPPRINGFGTAQVVMTDALGQVTTLSFPMYDTGRLLARGLSDWSVELGTVRRDYGRRSFSYGRDPVLSGTWRRGLSDGFTLETHAEGMRGLGLAGVGAVLQLGPAGLASAALAHSSAGGHQANLGWSWTRERFNVGMSGTRSRGRYHDVAARHAALPARGTARVSLGYSTAGWGSFNLSYLYLRQVSQPATRFVSLGWFSALGRTVSLSAGLNQNLDQRRERTLFLSLNWTLDGRTSVGAGVQHERHRATAVVSAQRATPLEGGWGWRTSARAGDTPGGQLELSRLGRYGRAQVGASDDGHGSRHVYAGASGALALMAGRGFAARRIDDAFVVADTSGVAGVPVKLENRVVGETDGRGLLLVTPVNAYQNNRLAIDPMRLPAAVRVARTEAEVSPADRAGAVVRFGLEVVRAASIRLVDAAGQPLPLGSRVTVNGEAGAGAVVGYDGLVYLERLAETNTLSVQSSQGHCRVSLQWQPDPTGSLPQLGPLQCVPETGR